MKTTFAEAKMLIGSGSGARSIRATGAKRELGGKMRYKRPVILKMLNESWLQKRHLSIRYKIAAALNLLFWLV